MRGLALLPTLAVVLIGLIALLVPVLPLPDPLKIDVLHRLAGPSLAHPLGLDEYGRDELSRLLWGARVSLAVALAASALACIFGTLLGLLGGFLGGFVEFLSIRSMDIVLCFPPLLLALLIVTLLGPGASTLIPVLAVLFLPGFVRVVYAGVLSVRSQEYVEAMRALGAGQLRIMLGTILPNVGGPVLVQLSLAAAVRRGARIGPVLSRARRRPALAFLGPDDRRRAQHHGAGPAAAGLALRRAERHHPRPERALRRAARRLRSARADQGRHRLAPAGGAAGRPRAPPERGPRRAGSLARDRQRRSGAAPGARRLVQRGAGRDPGHRRRNRARASRSPGSP